MTVKEVMSTHVATVNSDDSISKVASIMKDNNVGAVPVVCGNEVCGIITDRDIVIRCVASGNTSCDCKVGDVMTSSTKTASADWTVNQALEVMAKDQVRRLPVTENGKLTGIVSLGDIARQRQNPEVAKTLCEISLP